MITPPILSGADLGILEAGGGGGGGVPRPHVIAEYAREKKQMRKIMKIRVPNKRFPGIWDQNLRFYSDLDKINKKYLSLQE